MDHMIAELGAATLAVVVLGAAALYGYLKIAKTVPREHRLRLLVIMTTLPAIVVTAVITGNPPYALFIPLLMAISTGPSG